MKLLRSGASAVVLASKAGARPEYEGQEEVLKENNTELRIFNKPTTRPYRRMGVVLCNGNPEADASLERDRAVQLAKRIKILHT